MSSTFLDRGRASRVERNVDRDGTATLALVGRRAALGRGRGLDLAVLAEDRHLCDAREVTDAKRAAHSEHALCIRKGEVRDAAALLLH